jgi:hypothetical protein
VYNSRRRRRRRRRKVYRRRRRVFKANKENEEASGREKDFKLTRSL